MSCPGPICRIISCPVTDDLPSYLGQYNLQSGVTYENLLISVPAPGGGSYYVPPGTIVINVPPGATSVSYQGCQSTVTSAIPPGSNPAAIQAIVNQVMQQVAQQLAICNAPEDPHNPGSPFPPVTFSNKQVFQSCPSGLLMNLIGDLPKNVSFDIAGLTLNAGMFSSSVSVADADANAVNFLVGLIAGGALVQCGYWNTEITCPSGTIIPPDTYFSIESQVAANDLAIASGCLGFNPLDLVWGSGQEDAGDFTGTVTKVDNGTTGIPNAPFSIDIASSGAVGGTSEIIYTVTVTNDTDADWNLQAIPNITTNFVGQDGCMPTDGVDVYIFESVTFTDMGESFYTQDIGCVRVDNPFIPFLFTVPAHGNYTFQLLIRASVPIQDGINSSVNFAGNITVANA